MASRSTPARSPPSWSRRPGRCSSPSTRDSFGPTAGDAPGVVGYGAAIADFPGTPNVLRVLVGEAARSSPPNRVVVLECEIDDMNPQLFGPLMDRLYEAGALDVFYAPVQMKKNRPGTLVTVLARPERREALDGVLFAETTTIGVRYQEVQRECLEREVRSVATPVGADPVQGRQPRRPGAQRVAGVRGLCDAPRPSAACP